MKERISRLLHDMYADVSSRFGRSVRVIHEPLSGSEIKIDRTQPTVWHNSSEHDIYGDTICTTEVFHPHRSILMLDNAFVTGSEALVFVAPNTLLRPDKSQTMISDRKIRRPIQVLARKEAGNIFHMGGRGVGNRGHFLCEHLPRLLLARKALGFDFPLRMMLTPDHSDWQSEYLALFGESLLDSVKGTRGTIQCEHLVYLPNLSNSCTADLAEPNLYKELRKRILSKCTNHQTSGEIFLSRKDASSRRLLNEDAVYELCKERWPNLIRICLTGMPLPKQIEMFASARVLIGAHGQAFHLGLFSTDALIVQLVPGERYPTNEYVQWATNYERLGLINMNKCVSLYAGTGPTSTDWSFPLQAFRSQLNLIIEKLGFTG